jgi:hypothetical protein
MTLLAFILFTIFAIGTLANVENTFGKTILQQVKDHLPLEDPFLKPPAGFEKAPPGSILRYRSVTQKIKLLSFIPLNVFEAWQILYRTQNSVGEPEATIVTLLVPFNKKSDNLFSLSYFTVGFPKFDMEGSI